ncbi:hypothetical protein [Ruegeria halocynthiae]|uniref:hypothetical protein n=1 Tax=Ruegeria halocynthiae TaxID=985054 RepID=UPI00055C411B|nr:hypothetical protein [Ruegeria halocynthiae]
MALIIQYFMSLGIAPTNYGFAPGKLSIHKCFNPLHLSARDACLHRQSLAGGQLPKQYTDLHHLRKKLPKFPP